MKTLFVLFIFSTLEIFVSTDNNVPNISISRNIELLKRPPPVHPSIQIVNTRKNVNHKIKPAKKLNKLYSKKAGKIKEYTVFTDDKLAKVASPYFEVEHDIVHKPRVKKILPGYFGDSLTRSKRSVVNDNKKQTPKKPVGRKQQLKRAQAVQKGKVLVNKQKQKGRVGPVKAQAKKRQVGPKVGTVKAPAKKGRAGQVKLQAKKGKVGPKVGPAKGQAKKGRVGPVKQQTKKGPVNRLRSKKGLKQKPKNQNKARVLRLLRTQLKKQKRSGALNKSKVDQLKRSIKPVHPNISNKGGLAPAGNRTKLRSKKQQAQVQGKQQLKKVKAERRLIAGRDATVEDYPYVVSIQKSGEHWCTGSLLNPRLVITTANCIWKSNRMSRLTIRAGSRHLDHGGQKAKVAEVMKHPRWGIRGNPDFDVGLMLLDRNLRFSDKLHGVDLPNKLMSPPFEDAWVVGWGADRRDGIYEQRGNTLQVYYSRLMSHSKCNNITQRFGVSVTPRFICLEQIGKRAPCTRDTGAPAVSDGVLWGVASWGIRKLCGTERFPAMFSYIGSPEIMMFLMNATARLMSDEQFYPFLDKTPVEYYQLPTSSTTKKK